MTALVRVPGRGWAYTGAVLGGLVSIAANVAHSFIPPHGSPADWAPEPGAVVGAVVWPVFLFVAVEIFVRIRWPHGVSWHLLRWVGLLPVAAVAAFVSYRHLSGLLAHYGEEPIIYYVGPLAVDGLMVMATGALMATSRHRTTAPALAPVMSMSVPTAAPAAVVGSPVVPTSPPPARVAAAAPVSPAIPVPSPAQVAHRITQPRPAPTASAAAAKSGTHTTRPRPSKTTNPSRRPAPSTIDTPVTALDVAKPALPVPPAMLSRARQVATEYRAEHGTPITAGQLAVRLKVTSEQAAQALAVLNLEPANPTTPVPTVNGTPVKDAR